MKTNKNLQTLCEAAVMIAFATVLGLLMFPPFRIDLWGNGGSIDFVMIPLIILAWRRGIMWGVPAGLVFGLIKCLISGGIGWGLPSVLLDYVLAYGAVGLAGVFKGRKYGLVLGAVLASLARFAIHFVSGITIYKLAVGDSAEIFGMTFGGDGAVLYSLFYNGGYMLGNLVLAVVVLAVLRKPIEKLPR